MSLSERGSKPLLTRISYIGHINIFALIAGFITLYLVLQSGELILLVSNLAEGGNVSIGFGGAELNILGNKVSIPVLDYLVISSKLSYLIASISLIAGSLIKDEKLAKGLIGFKLPSMTGLALAVLVIVLTALGGVFDPSEAQVSFTVKLMVAGEEVVIPIAYKFVVTLNTYLAIAANVFAILGRLAVKELDGYVDRVREIATSIYLPL